MRTSPRPPFAVPGRRHAPAVLGAVLVLALAGLLGAAGSASAALPRSFTGLHAWEVPTADEFKQIGRANVGWYRSNVVWSQVEARRGRYDWAANDAMFARAAAARVRVLPIMLGSPEWASAKIWSPPRSAGGRAAYTRFVAAAVRRYGPGGAFWSEYPELPSLPATHWQIWNEPNLPNYWHDRPSARQYASLLKTASRAARRAAPEVKVVLAGLPESGSGIPITRYLHALYRVRGVKQAFDVVAVHPYARDYRGVLGALSRVRRVMRHHRDLATSTWVTEVGWATGPEPDSRGFVTSQRGQASRLTTLYRALIRRRRGYRLLGAMWFSYRDAQRFPGGDDWWAMHTGLFTSRGRAKPAWHALLALTAGDDYAPARRSSAHAASGVGPAPSDPYAPVGP